MAIDTTEYTPTRMRGPGRGQIDVLGFRIHGPEADRFRLFALFNRYRLDQALTALLDAQGIAANGETQIETPDALRPAIRPDHPVRMNATPMRDVEQLGIRADRELADRFRNFTLYNRFKLGPALVALLEACEIPTDGQKSVIDQVRSRSKQP